MNSCNKEKKEKQWKLATQMGTIEQQHALLDIPLRSRSKQNNPSSVPSNIRSGSMISALWAPRSTVKLLSSTSRTRNMAVFGKLFRFKMRCNSLNATTHLAFSDSVSANINVCDGKPPSINDVVIYMQINMSTWIVTASSKTKEQSHTRNMHGTSLFAAWMTSLSRTPVTANSGSRISNTFEWRSGIWHLELNGHIFIGK